MEEEPPKSAEAAAEGLKRRSLARGAFSTHRLSSLTPGIHSALASPGRYHKILVGIFFGDEIRSSLKEIDLCEDFRIHGKAPYGVKRLVADIIWLPAIDGAALIENPECLSRLQWHP
ncbi:hypothetical protein QJS04_geneDACA011954 [Acorus gramineus]|uniref:Uncharacterized protein n=1 Tax=Acorus gramineus TaxID=55184 RepID=A0AAV9AHQ4_ACOGR|nr:hypothetical protein QJS04_geneDACA011954 [Acorus gramineus]